MNATSRRLSIFVPEMIAGGAQRSMLKLAGGMAARGHKVDLVLACAQGPFLAEVPASVRLIDLKARRVMTSLPGLVRYLRRERPDALLSVLHANPVAIWARRQAGVPTRLVVSERNTLSCAVRSVSDLRMSLMPQLARWFYPWADSIVTVSKGVADDLAHLTRIPRERIQVIYNPIVTPELRVRARAPLEHPWFGKDEPPVVLAVGRLVEQKDFPTLIRAFAQVRRTHKSRLLILGEGEERPALEALARQLGLEDGISLPGFVGNPYPYMSQASVFVLSSRWEGLPGALIEALYCGAPVVATDCPSGPREILAEGKYGRLVPIGDVNALAQSIRFLLDNRPPPVSQESWQPFELAFVVNQYTQLLFERPSQNR
jgi:glycosyltransferase involved in cell wall biosynthesis